MMGFIHGLQGHMHFHAGRMEQALACQRACGEVMRSLMITSPGVVMPWRTHAARAMRALGDLRAARTLAEEELEAGVRCLREAVEVLSDSGAALEHARAQVELGAAIRRAGLIDDSAALAN